MSAAALGKLLHELAELYEDESKKTELLRNWNSWKAIVSSMSVPENWRLLTQQVERRLSSYCRRFLCLHSIDWLTRAKDQVINATVQPLLNCTTGSLGYRSAGRAVRPPTRQSEPESCWQRCTFSDAMGHNCYCSDTFCGRKEYTSGKERRLSQLAPKENDARVDARSQEGNRLGGSSSRLECMGCWWR